MKLILDLDNNKMSSIEPTTTHVAAAATTASAAAASATPVSPPAATKEGTISNYRKKRFVSLKHLTALTEICRVHGVDHNDSMIVVVDHRKSASLLNPGTIHSLACFKHDEVCSSFSTRPVLNWDTAVFPNGWKIASIIDNAVTTFEIQYAERPIVPMYQFVRHDMNGKVLGKSEWKPTAIQALRSMFKSYEEFGADPHIRGHNGKVHTGLMYECPQFFLCQHFKRKLDSGDHTWSGELLQRVKDWTGRFDPTLGEMFYQKGALPSSWESCLLSGSSSSSSVNKTLVDLKEEMDVEEEKDDDDDNEDTARPDSTTTTTSSSSSSSCSPSSPTTAIAMEHPKHAADPTERSAFDLLFVDETMTTVLTQEEADLVIKQRRDYMLAIHYAWSNRISPKITPQTFHDEKRLRANFPCTQLVPRFKQAFTVTRAGFDAWFQLNEITAFLQYVDCRVVYFAFMKRDKTKDQPGVEPGCAYTVPVHSLDAARMIFECVEDKKTFQGGALVQFAAFASKMLDFDNYLRMLYHRFKQDMNRKPIESIIQEFARDVPTIPAPMVTYMKKLCTETKIYSLAALALIRSCDEFVRVSGFLPRSEFVVKYLNELRIAGSYPTSPFNFHQPSNLEMPAAKKQKRTPKSSSSIETPVVEAPAVSPPAVVVPAPPVAVAVEPVKGVAEAAVYPPISSTLRGALANPYLSAFHVPMAPPVPFNTGVLQQPHAPQMWYNQMSMPVPTQSIQALMDKTGMTATPVQTLF